MIILDDLDKKALELFRGFVVKKDLVGIIKGGANVPAFVLEYLLANTCSTEDEEKLKETEKLIAASKGLKPEFVVGDQTKESVVIETLNSAIKNFGGFDGVESD